MLSKPIIKSKNKNYQIIELNRKNKQCKKKLYHKNCYTPHRCTEVKWDLEKESVKECGK